MLPSHVGRPWWRGPIRSSVGAGPPGPTGSVSHLLLVCWIQAMEDTRTRREEYSEATKRALLDAATSLFATRGFRETSLDEVAERCRVTKGAVYHHFSSKQALFEAVL